MTRTVLQILPRLITGGVERGTVEVAAALVKAGWTSLVASAGGSMVDEIQAAGATHITLPLASKNPLVILSNIGRLRDVIHQYDVDIVHARSRAPAWSAYYAAHEPAHKKQRHFVTTFHNAYGAASALKRRYNSVMARGERVIAISGFVAEHARRVYGVPENILSTIPRGVDLVRFNPAVIDRSRVDALRQAWRMMPQKPVIMLPGRLTRWKGQEIFVRALAKISSQDFQAVIVGSGDPDYRAEIQQLISSLSLENKVFLVDECRDMPAAFTLADYVVSASTRPEGFGRVVVEAQAMGCPVIATEHGGSSETVLDGATGWLITPGNIESLSETIGHALSIRSEKHAQMGELAMQHVRQNFTTELMTKRTLNVYKELVPV